jgi:CRP-like cAMP-binding protein
MPGISLTSNKIFQKTSTMNTELVAPKYTLDEIVRLVHPMSDEAIALLAARVSERHVKKGEIIVREGSVCNEIFLIRSGVFRNFADDGDGGEDTRWFAYSGDPVASMFSLAQNLPAIASIEALTSADLYVVNKSVLYSLIHQSHEWAEWVSYFFIDGLYVLERRYTFLGRGDAMSRYTNFLRMRPKWMVNLIPLKYIASYLNITPQTLSNIRRRVKQLAVAPNGTAEESKHF